MKVFSQFSFLDFLLLFLAFSLLVYDAFSSRYDARPHHVTQSINGHVISDFWTTNPYVLVTVQTNMWKNGMLYPNCLVEVTQKLW